MLKRYKMLIPLAILVVILVAACTGTPVGVPQTGDVTQPTEAAQTVGGGSEAATAAPQATDAAPQATDAVPQATDAAPQATDAATPVGGTSPSIPETAPATGDTAGIPATGQTTDKKPESSVGELPNAQPAEMQEFIGAAQDLPENVQAAVANYLVTMLNVNPDKVLIVSAVEREFNNACLGLALEGESCAETITPGWLAIGIVNGSYYVVHTNEDGANLRLENSIDNTGLTNFGRDFPIHGVTSE
jgi:hypothetical protein